MWIAHRTGRTVGSLAWEGGDCHLYEVHKPIADKILSVYSPAPTPDLVYTPTSEDFRADDFTLSCEYKPLFTQRAEMVV